jgi:hypothetical protein
MGAGLSDKRLDVFCRCLICSAMGPELSDRIDFYFLLLMYV